MTVYEIERRIFGAEANPKLHPKLHTIAPENLKSETKRVPLPVLGTHRQNHWKADQNESIDQAL